jgi:hypothetical protein
LFRQAIAASGADIISTVFLVGAVNVMVFFHMGLITLKYSEVEGVVNPLRWKGFQ